MTLFSSHFSVTFLLPYICTIVSCFAHCLLWLGKMAKSFSIFIFNFHFHLFSWITTIKVKHGKGVMSLSQCYKKVWYWSQNGHITGHNTWQASHMTSNIRTVGGEVHSYNSSCIYSIENQMGTLLSSPCQLGLRGWLSHLRLSCYTAWSNFILIYLNLFWINLNLREFFSKKRGHVTIAWSVLIQ